MKTVKEGSMPFSVVLQDLSIYILNSILNPLKVYKNLKNMLYNNYYV